MSGQIRMSPEELKARAKTYGQGGTQIEQLLQSLTNLQSDLRNEWEGQAFRSFDDQFIELTPKVQNFAQLLHDIERQLTETANAVAEHDAALSRNFGLR